MSYKNILPLLAGGLFSLALSAQSPVPVWAADFVRIKDGRRAEALYYYENNWKLYRDTALARGHISGYRLLETTPDSLGRFDLILLTMYPDSAAYAASETNFAPILKRLRPEGPRLLNQLKANAFRESAFFKTARTVFAAEAPRTQPVKTPPAAALPYLKELDRDIWIPFAEAYASGDAGKYLALHAADFIRAEGGGQKTNDLAGYGKGVREGFERGARQGGRSTIEFRFFERFANEASASERGIYKYTYYPPAGEPRGGYGQFHVISRKENGRWKILVDYDSDEGNTIDAADFHAGKGVGEW